MTLKDFKISLIIPIYYNENNLIPLYDDLKNKFIDRIDYQYELVLIYDGSKDNSYNVMRELAAKDKNIKIIKLSKNFGSHAAILCGLANCTGDAAIIKAADLQEPTELLHEMIDSWKSGNNVVLAVRKSRNDSKTDSFFLIYIMKLLERLHFQQCLKKVLMCI